MYRPSRISTYEKDSSPTWISELANVRMVVAFQLFKTYLNNGRADAKNPCDAPACCGGATTKGAVFGSMFPRSTSKRGAPGVSRAGVSGLGGHAVDSERRRTVAHAAPVLPQRQDGVSPVSTVMRARSAARGRGDRRARELHRCNIFLGEGRRRRKGQHPPWQGREDSREGDRHRLAPSVSTHATDHHGVALWELNIHFSKMEAGQPILIGGLRVCQRWVR